MSDEIRGITDSHSSSLTASEERVTMTDRQAQVALTAALGIEGAVMEHWTERAERTAGGDHRILGEDEDGDLLVPTRGAPGTWRGRFNPRNPSHWVPYLRSRITRKIAFLERVDD